MGYHSLIVNIDIDIWGLAMGLNISDREQRKRKEQQRAVLSIQWSSQWSRLHHTYAPPGSKQPRID